MVSDTSAVSVGEGRPAARCRKRIAAGRSFKVLPAWPRIAAGGEEGGNLAGGGGQGREPVLVAPGAPGAHRGAVGGAGVFCLRAAAIGAGGLVRGGEAAVVLRFFCRRQDVEPVSHHDRRAADGRVRRRWPRVVIRRRPVYQRGQVFGRVTGGRRPRRPGWWSSVAPRGGEGTCPPVGRYGAVRQSGLDRQPRALGTNAAFSAGAVVPGAAEAPDRWASSQDDGQAGRRAAGNRGAGAHQAAPRDVVGGVADGRGPGTSGWHFTICSPEKPFPTIRPKFSEFAERL